MPRYLFHRVRAGRPKLAEDRPDFEQEPWDEPTPPAEDAPVWFPDVDGPDHENPTELDDPELAGPGGSTTTTTLPPGGGSTTTTTPGGGTTTTTVADAGTWEPTGSDCGPLSPDFGEDVTVQCWLSPAQSGFETGPSPEATSSRSCSPPPRMSAVSLSKTSSTAGAATITGNSATVHSVVTAQLQ